MRLALCGGMVAVLLGLVPAARAADAGRFVGLEAKLTQPRSGHSAMRLPDGRVLIAGGFGGANVRSAELFDPSTGAFTALTGPNQQFAVQRLRPAVATLADGRILYAGGNGLQSAELFDPATMTFSTLPNAMTNVRAGAAAGRLPDGRVLIAGGQNGSNQTLSTAEMFDPVTQQFTALAGTFMQSGRAGTATAVLPGGRILITGGANPGGNPQRTTEVFNPGPGTFTLLADLNQDRNRPVIAPLLDGRILVAGGTDASLFPQADAELYDPAADRWDRLTGFDAEMRFTRTAGAAVALADGRILVTGGTEFDEAIDTAELFEQAPSPQITGSGAFGQQQVGSVSAVRTLSLSNTSLSTLEVGRAAVEGGAGDFTVERDGCAGARLGQGQSCDVLVRFSPSELGPRAAELVILDNAPSRVQRVALSGDGVPFVAPPAAAPPAAKPPRGPTVSCALRRRTGRRQLRCTVTPALKTQKVTRITLVLTRGGKTLATGSARGPRLTLRAKKALRPGSYTVRSTLTIAGATTVVTKALVLK